MGFVYGYLNLAPGENNTGELKPLWQWNTCGVFDTYKRQLEVRWYNDEGREPSGSGRNKPVSLPNVKIILKQLHLYGFRTIRDDILDGENLDNFVTAHLYCPADDTWLNYNGRMEIPPDAPDKFTGGEYQDVEFSIYELIEI